MSVNSVDLEASGDQPAPEPDHDHLRPGLPVDPLGGSLVEHVVMCDEIARVGDQVREHDDREKSPDQIPKYLRCRVPPGDRAEHGARQDRHGKHDHRDEHAAAATELRATTQSHRADPHVEIEAGRLVRGLRGARVRDVGIHGAERPSHNARYVT